MEADETVCIPMRPIGDTELLRILIAPNGVTQSVAARGAGVAESTVSKVLAGKRKLNRSQIANFARYFQVEPGVFLRD